MDRHVFRVINELQVLMQSFPGGSSSDTVTITIFDLTDNVTDVNGVAMTYVTLNTWKYEWTPLEAHFYSIDFYNAQQDTHFYEYTEVTE